MTEPGPRPVIARADYQSLIDQAAQWQEAMVQAGTDTQADPASHERNELQTDFNDAKREPLAVRNQIEAAAGLN